MDEERDLLAAAQAGDVAARQALVTAHMGLVHRLASKFAGVGVDVGDLCGEGVLGLYDAIDAYNADHQTRFSTVAFAWIKGRMRRFVRKAQSSDLSWDTLHDMLSDSSHPSELAQCLASSAPDAETLTFQRETDALLENLAPNERAILGARFAHDVVTLRELAESRGVSRERIRQIEVRALAKLRAVLAA